MLLVEMAYPITFKMEEFKALRSFAARRRYCQERLQKLGEGSSRVVFEIDEFKVLKLAKNAKGIAQNEAEGGSGFENITPNVIAKTLDMDEKTWLWVEMERAKKINAARFKQLTGIGFKEFALSLSFEETRHNPNIARYRHIQEPEWQEQLWNDNEFFREVIEMLINFDLPFGDYMQMKHYGEVEDRCVIIDYGFNKEVLKAHYTPKQQRVF